MSSRRFFVFLGCLHDPLISWELRIVFTYFAVGLFGRIVTASSYIGASPAREFTAAVMNVLVEVWPVITGIRQKKQV